MANQLVGISQRSLGVAFQRGDHSRHKVLMVTVIGVGVVQVLPASQWNGAVPSHVQRFTLSAYKLDLWIFSNKLLANSAFALRGAAINYYHFHLTKQGLCNQILQTTPYKTFGFVCRNNHGN